jgi:Na+-transporting NADH:ubiquinone oxidoreductase subunit NqrE
MNGTKTVKFISNTIYAIGSAVALTLSIISLFGPNKAVFPMAMIPSTYKGLAFIWLAFGTVPMLLVCMAVYKFNNLTRCAK